MDSDLAKVVCLVVLLVDTWLFGWFPYFLVHRGSQSERGVQVRSVIISYLNCFAGGVFLGACMLHLLVEGRETLQDYFDKSGQDIDFPVYESVAACGFFIIALVEQMAHKYLHQTLPGQDHHHDHGHHHGNGHAYNASQSDKSLSRFGASASYKSISDESSSLTGNGNGEIQHINGHDHMPEEEEPGGEHSHMGELVEVIGQVHASPLKAFLLLGALSFHTVFDGLAVGAQTTASGIWEMFTAIIIHKSLVALCLGQQLFLVYIEEPLKAAFWVFVFSIITPVGVEIGLIVTSGHIDEPVERLVSGLLQALATGTFLYVTFFEILKDELTERRGFFRLVVVVLGFGGMALAKYFDKD